MATELLPAGSWSIAVARSWRDGEAAIARPCGLVELRGREPWRRVRADARPGALSEPMIVHGARLFVAFYMRPA